MHPAPYLPDESLHAALEVAYDLQLPLLVTGEPGTGKTQLAYYAASLYTPGKAPLVFNVKTTSQARDLFYTYDGLRHFREAGRPGSVSGTFEYISFEALGRAIAGSAAERRVVLIDEIDKAPRDFPNDLLYEFDQMAFRVQEASLGEIRAWAAEHPELNVDDQGFIRLAPAAQRPILILTSNSEKNLPDAFLRRVAYYHIEFPDSERLAEIVKSRMAAGSPLEAQMLTDAVAHFLQIRDQRNLRKKPATAELLAWLHVLRKEHIDITQYDSSSAERELKLKIFQSYSLIAKNKEDLAILKTSLGL